MCAGELDIESQTSPATWSAVTGSPEQIPELTADERYDIREAVRESFEEVQAESAQWNAEEEARAETSLTMTPAEADCASVYLERISNHYRNEVWMAGFAKGLAIGGTGVFILMSYIIFLMTT